MSRAGIVCGLASEARIVRRASAELPTERRPLVAVAGGSIERARALGSDLARDGATILVSFGLAGGLDPALRPGDLVLPALAKARGGREHAAEANCRDQLAKALAAAGAHKVHAIVSTADPVLTVLEKAALREASGANCVDMESAGVAEAAAEAGCAFAVLRAVADPAGRDVPRAAFAGMGPDGRARPLRVLLGLLRRPGELPELIATARDARAGLDALRGAAAAALAVLSRV